MTKVSILTEFVFGTKTTKGTSAFNIADVLAESKSQQKRKPEGSDGLQPAALRECTIHLKRPAH